MRVARATKVLAIAVIIGAATAARAEARALTADAASRPGSSTAPTRSEIARAVHRAESSASLWATVNICNSPRYPDALGVRAQMPTLGFTSTLSMVVQTEYWSNTDKRFVAISGTTAVKTLSLGTVATGLQQAGEVFPFPAHAGLLSASVQFQWALDGRVVGETVRPATDGHPNAAFGSPPHYSAASCRIP